MSELVTRAARLVVQVRARGHRPVSGGVWGVDRILVAADGVDQEEDVSVRTEGGRIVSGTFAGRDPSTGLALVKAPNLEIEPAEAAPEVRVGQPIIELGRGWSGAIVAGFGLVSSLGGPTRMGRGPAIEQVIRTDASRYPGFEGGIVLDLSGKLVGIPLGVALRGLAVVVPAAVAARVGETLATHGRMPRAYLGIGTQPVRLAPAQRGSRNLEQGLLIVAVSDGSPADRGGLLVGDILLQFDGRAVNDAEELLNLLGPDRVGRTVPLEIVRGKDQRTETVVVGQR
jgi:S1-C subfamily serine protease